MKFSMLLLCFLLHSLFAIIATRGDVVNSDSENIKKENSTNGSIASTTPSLNTLQLKTTVPPTPKAKLQPATNKPKPVAVIKKSESTIQCPSDRAGLFILFPLPCKRNRDCALMGPGHLCCKRSCLLGVPKPRAELPHTPLLGLIPRGCPIQPLAELGFPLRTCNTDADCWPRVCCPDGEHSYCRSATAKIDQLPLPNARRFTQPFVAAADYLRCTPAPPPLLDLFPRPCNSTLECFPNICCQEHGSKFCRPPQRSLLALVAGFSQRFGGGIWNFFSNNNRS